MALGLICLLFLSASVGADWLDGDQDVDRPYGDLAGMPVSLAANAAPRECALRCQANSSCVAWAYCSAASVGAPTPVCYLKETVEPQKYSPGKVSGVKGAQLLPPAFRPLPLCAIKPTGWLRQQLQTQADSLSGHLPLFWADIMNSSWVGGGADGGLHERTPYWLNGFVPLAYQLGEPELTGLVGKYVDFVLSHQTADGWLGLDDIKDGNMYWSKYPMLFALRQYYEANSTDTRVLPAVMKFLQACHKRLFTTALGSSWSGARWQDLTLTVHWMLEQHPLGQEQMLWDLAELLHQQGFNWNDWYGGDHFPTDTVTAATLFTHGVNNGQAIKTGGVWYRQSHDQLDRQASYVAMENLDKYHGQASGIFSCDEHLAGKMPSHGTELCTVVESMFSYETLFSIHGDPIFAERAERLAYNALPATITPDMWAHQYLQQANEMNAVHSDSHVWNFDGPDSTLFGLAPNYGCCTANFNQGWPKFTEHLVMMTHSGSSSGSGGGGKEEGEGLVVGMYAPCIVDYTFPSTGMSVELNIVTDYPFDDTVTIAGNCVTGITLSLRIPSWAQAPTVQVNQTAPKPAVAGTLYNLTCVGSTVVVLKLPMRTSVERRFNNAASIFRGPLLYGLDIVENFTALREYAFQSKDYQVTPASPWNYAVKIQDDSAVDKDLSFVHTGLMKGVPPFSKKGAPVKIVAQGREFSSWGLTKNAASPPPQSPVTSSSPLTSITLLPFGATNLRIAELPTTKG